MVRKPIFCLAIGACALYLGWSAPLRAETMAERHERLVEGAKKEGQVVFWHIGPVRKKEVIGAFRKKYPFLKLKLWRHRGAEGTTKAIAEAKAGITSLDVYLAADIEVAAVQRAGIMATYDFPNTKDGSISPTTISIVGSSSRPRLLFSTPELCGGRTCPKPGMT